jgi:hypothetical protein
MHFLKYINKHSNDPRCQNYYIYVCNICGHEEQIFTSSNIEKSNRRCPECGVIDDVDEMTYYTAKKSDIENKIKKLNDELYAIVSKIQILTLTKENNHETVSNTV